MQQERAGLRSKHCQALCWRQVIAAKAGIREPRHGTQASVGVQGQSFQFLPERTTLLSSWRAVKNTTSVKASDRMVNASLSLPMRLAPSRCASLEDTCHPHPPQPTPV